MTLAAVVLLCAPEAGAESKKRIALVIGNGDFQGSYSLTQPANDAKNIAAVLEATGFSVTTLIDSDLTAMAKAGRAFLDAAPGAELRLFYYSGYGVQAGGSNWLIPARSEASKSWSAKTEAFSADSMLTGMAAAGPGTNVFILDACRDSPFSDRSGAKGLAQMSAENSIVALSAAPGSTMANDPSRAGSVFTEAIAKALPLPGRSLQEILYSSSDLVGASSKAKQVPWISTTLPRLSYLITPQEAFQGVQASKTASETDVKQLEARVSDLKARTASEKDASQRRVYEAELKAQAELLDAKKRELDAIKNEQQRLVSTNEAIAEEMAMLEALRVEQAESEKAISKLAELRHWEIGAMVDRAAASDDFLTAMESAAAMRLELGKSLDASLATFKASMEGAYEKRIRAVTSWTQYPWESDDFFRSRVSAERTRLACERQARGNALTAEASAKAKALLEPFDESFARALDGLEHARESYSGEDVRITVGAYDRDSSSYPITIASQVPEIPFTTTFPYSIASEDLDVLRDKYKEFEAWQAAKAFSAEIDTSISSVNGVGFAVIVDAFRMKVVDASGERLLVEEKPVSAVAYFKGTADRSRPIRVSSWLSAVGYGTQISVNGGLEKKDRLFMLNPKAGDYVVRASYNDRSYEERRVSIAAGGHALVEFRLGRFSVPWIAAGSTLNVRKLANAPTGERSKGNAVATDELVRSFTISEASAFRSPLLPEGSYQVVINGEYPYTANIILTPASDVVLPGYVDSLTATMIASRDSMTTMVEKKRARTKIGLIALGAGAAGAIGATASYFLGAAAADDLRNAKGTPEAVDAHKRMDIYGVVFPITAVVGAIGLGISPGLLIPGQNPDKMQKSIDILDAQIKKLAK
jgi:uncharacterized caspase-like protein